MNVQRLWLYFRLGHGSYLSLASSMANFVVIQYVLFIQRFPELGWLRLYTFAGFFIIAYGLVAVVMGYYHRQKQLPVEEAVGVIQNPYTWKVQPGREQLLTIPLAEFNLEMLRRIMQRLDLLTPDLVHSFDIFKLRLEKFREGVELRQ